MILRKFRKEDALEASALICRTLREVNIRDYDPEYIENDVKVMQKENLIRRMERVNFYIAQEGNKIIGIGGITEYWGKKDESFLQTIFVLPEYIGKGVGRRIMEKIEEDELFKRAERIEVPSSITASGFYMKMGYDFKNGIKVLDEDKLYRMEKFNNKSVKNDTSKGKNKDNKVVSR